MAFKRIYTESDPQDNQMSTSKNKATQRRFKRISSPNRSLSNFTREGYQLPSKDDPFYDSAKQVAYQGVRGLLGGVGDIANLIGTGAYKGLEYLGVPKNILDIASQASSYIAPKTSQDIDVLAKNLGINPKANTKAGRIAGNIADVIGSSLTLGSSPRAITALGLGEALGEAAIESGLPEPIGTGIKVASAFAGGNKKGLVVKKSQKPIVDFLRKHNLNDNEITPLLQSSGKVATLSKVALKGEKVSKLAKNIKDKVGQIYESLKDQSKNAPILTTPQKDRLVSEMFAKRNKIPIVFQKSIDPIIKRFENSMGTIEDLIIFYQDINASTKGIQGGKAVLGTFKPFASKNISMLDSKIGKEFELTNSLYEKAAKFRKSFKSDLIDKGLNVTELYKLANYLITRNLKGLTGIVGKYSARALARELLTNPKLQNLSKRLGIALKENKTNKVRAILRAMQKESPELEQSNSKSQ